MYAKGGIDETLQSEGVEAGSFEELAQKAIRDIGNRHGLTMVCGPITTGGTGDQTLNFNVFNATVRGLGKRGEQLFNQVPYEFGLRKLAQRWQAQGNSGYCMPILTIFYATVFESGRISKGVFIPNYKSSFGATWERDKLTRVGSEIIYLTIGDVREFLEMEYPSSPEHVELIVGLMMKNNKENDPSA